MSKLIQQGDVLMTAVEAVPQEAKKAEPRNGRYILADGEATGHAHAVEVTPAVEMFEHGNDLYLSASKPVTVTHEEHNAITIDPGVYKIGKVLEYDHFEEEAREVID